MSLKTGHKLYGYHWVELPIGDKVIDRVEQLAEEQGQPLMENGPIFEWNPGDLIVNVDDDPEAMHKEMDEVEYPDDHNDDDQDPDVGGIPIAPRPTIITDEEDLEELEEDRSDDANKYKGDWTNELDNDEEQEHHGNEYDSRSDPSDSKQEDEIRGNEDSVSSGEESSGEESPVESDDAAETQRENTRHNMECETMEGKCRERSHQA